MKYSDLDRLEKELVRLSDGDCRTDEQLLREATFGARGLGDPIAAQLVAKLASRLYHHAGNGAVRLLTRGALAGTLEARWNAREFLPFALQLVHRASHASPSPSSIRLPDSTTTAAAARLEECKSSPARASVLIEAVRAFVERNDELAAGLIFARFIRDLEFLQSVLVDVRRSEEERRIATAALTYFVREDDAIDDELGVAGILDDAYVAQLAAERVDAPRRVKTALVDGVVGRWPFLTSLRFDMEAGDWSPSEFVLLNLAVARGPECTGRSAIVVPRVGDLPLWLGVLAAIGATYDSIDQAASPFRPAVGELVAVTGDSTQVLEVTGYCDVSGREWVPPSPGAEPPSSVRYVWLQYLPRGRKSQAPPVRQRKSVDFLATCVPASAMKSPRRTTLPSSRSDIPIGPLEHLFGMDHPPRLDGTRRPVVAVAPIGHAKELLSKTTVFGSPITDLLPCGRVLPEHHYAVECWSPRVGTRSPSTHALPVLTIARSLSEAAAIARRSRERVSVIVSVDDAQSAAAAMGELANVDVCVVLPQAATDAQDDLRKASFRFLDWTPELEASVARRPRSARTSIDSYENAVRRDLHSRVEVHDVDLDSVESCLAALKEFGRTMRDEYEDEAPGSLSGWAENARRVFFELDGMPLVLAGDSATRALADLAELRSDLERSGRMWSARCRKTATEQLAGLDRLCDDLRRRNPKAEVLASLLDGKEIAVRCSESRWDEFHRRFPQARKLVDVEDRSPAVLFDWPGRKRITHLLYPPVGDPTHIVFYRWEREGLHRVQRDRVRRVEEHWGPVSRPPAWHLDDVPNSRRERAAAPDPPAAFVLDDWRASLRKQAVRARAARLEGPPIPARAVYFVGGAQALYTDTYPINVVADAGRAESDERTLHVATVSELRVGDFVLCISGSSRDAIRERADARLPPGTRELARLWQAALLSLRRTVLTDYDLCEALWSAGCKKKEFTIGCWLRSETQIGPHDDSDVDAIANASGYPELTAKLQLCKDAITKVRGEHLRASKELYQLAFAEITRRLGSSDGPDSSISLGDRVEVLVVDEIDEEAVMVSETATNIVWRAE